MPYSVLLLPLLVNGIWENLGAAGEQLSVAMRAALSPFALFAVLTYNSNRASKTVGCPPTRVSEAGARGSAWSGQV
jgi:hypothetical protein